MTTAFVLGARGVLALALVGGGCGGAVGAPDRAVVRVLAASSLTEGFTALAPVFERDHPGVKVTLSFAGSSAIARQVLDGAPADVVVTADEATMVTMVDAGSARRPAVFARNRLVLLVEPGNPLGIAGLRDLARSDVVFVACAPEVPCGRLAAAALTRAGVGAAPASLEEQVKAVVAKVALGEADAGIAYATDARAAADSVDAVGIAAAPDLQAMYAAAVTSEAGDVDAARAWIDLLRSPRARRVLGRLGFLPV